MSNQTVTQVIVVPGTVPNFHQGSMQLALYNPDGTPFVLAPAAAVDDYKIAGETFDPPVDLAGLITQFNILLANLRAAGFLDSSEPEEPEEPAVRK